MLAKLFTAKSIKKSGHTSATHAEKGFPGQKPHKVRIFTFFNPFLFWKIWLDFWLVWFLFTLPSSWHDGEKSRTEGEPGWEGAVVPLGLGSERVNLFFLKEEIFNSALFTFFGAYFMHFAQFLRSALTQPLTTFASMYECSSQKPLLMHWIFAPI